MRKLKAQKYAAADATGPTGTHIPIFPAPFVKTDMGTGIVMSVPAHAPFDYCALKDLAAGNGAGNLQQRHLQ